jgi:hypothetical protein
MSHYIPQLKRQNSVPDDTIDEIQQMIRDNNKDVKNAIIDTIDFYLRENNLDTPNDIKIQSRRSGVYIKLQYFNIDRSLILVIHNNRGDSNRIHVKVTTAYNDSIVIAQNHCIWSDYDGGIIIDDSNRISNEILENEDYFYAIIGSVSDVYHDYYAGYFNYIYSGGSKNKKINYKDYNVLELKKMCKDKKIKNYSKLNKDDLLKLLKKNK